MPEQPLALSPADIQPMGGAAPAAPVVPEEAAPAPSGMSSNPAAMLEMLPAEMLDNDLIFAVAKGQPGAVSAPKKSSDPVVKAVIKHAEPLVAAGFGIYESIDKKNDVLFNTQTVDVGDLQEADQQGRLLELAPLFSTVKGNAAPAAGGEASAPPAPMGATPESQPASSVQNKLAGQRIRNLTPQGPTGGAAPGAGQILNSILKQPI